MKKLLQFKKTTFLVSAFFLTFTFLDNLQAQTFTWAKNMGGTSLDNGLSIAVDASGNVYTTGYFQGTADFDPGVGVSNLTSIGSTDIFISKLNASGTFVWAKQIGGAGSDIGRSIKVDASGNVYTTGHFSGSVDFNPGAGTFSLTSFGSNDIYVSKLDASGNFVWAKQMGGINNDQGYSIALDASSNVYTTGAFEGTADFDPNAGVSNSISAGSFDIFISKLDVNGNFVWAKSIGSTSDDFGLCITIDAPGNVLTSGYFKATADFDPSAATYTLTSVNARDIFISKLSSSGNFVWAKQIGGGGDQTANGLVTDASGNVYATGSFAGATDFDPSAGVFSLNNIGADDIFICALNQSGLFNWAKGIGSSGFDYGRGITLDGSGNVLTTGEFSGTADFDPGVGTNSLVAFSSSSDSYISKLNVNGNFISAKNIGSSGGAAVGNGIVSDASSNIYTTGYFSGTTDFDPNAGVFNLVSPGTQADVFVLKLSSCVSLNPIAATNNTVCAGSSINFSVTTTGTVTPTYSWSGPNSFTSNSQTPSIATAASIHSGVYTVTVTNGSCIETATTQVNVTICTGLKHNLQANLNTVIVYPNPASSSLTIKTEETIETVYVYNLLGAVVIEAKSNSFSIEHLAKGVYTLQIKTVNGTGTVRFIKE
ncbi:MAG: SBBP repeat-containing protein [Bacteroidia bacterium]|nr:SBBP repeat-containing protein [Bacteroidia bacterium]